MIFVMFSCPSSSIPAYLGHSIYLTYPAHLTYMTCLYWERARVARHGEKGLPRPTPQKGGFAPPSPALWKLPKPVGRKVDFNPLKFWRRLQGRIQFLAPPRPMNFSLAPTHPPAPLNFTEYFRVVNIFGGEYFSEVNIFQGWIFFRIEYFSGLNIFQRWIFLGVNICGVNIFSGCEYF